MTAIEMIRKYNISLHGEDQVAVPGGNKLSKKIQDELKAAKPEIIAELKCRAQKKIEAEAQRQTELVKELNDIKSGAKTIQLHYRDGEYLSGYGVYGQEAQILESLGLVKYINGWGCYIEPKTINALGGPEFTYQQAVELAKALGQAKEDIRQEKEDKLQAKFDEARETGKPVLLRQWVTYCCNPREECSMDNHREYAMPDGSIKHGWNHTW